MFIFNKVFCQHPLCAYRIVMDIINFLHQKAVRNNCLCIERIFEYFMQLAFFLFPFCHQIFHTMKQFSISFFLQPINNFVHYNSFSICNNGVKSKSFIEEDECKIFEDLFCVGVSRYRFSNCWCML